MSQCKAGSEFGDSPDLFILGSLYHKNDSLIVHMPPNMKKHVCMYVWGGGGRVACTLPPSPWG